MSNIQSNTAKRLSIYRVRLGKVSGVKKIPRTFLLCSESIGSMKNFSVARSGNNASLEAKEIRETFKEYFFNEGAVPWQWNSCMDVV